MADDNVGMCILLILTLRLDCSTIKFESWGILVCGNIYNLCWSPLEEFIGGSSCGDFGGHNDDSCRLVHFRYSFDGDSFRGDFI